MSLHVWLCVCERVSVFQTSLCLLPVGGWTRVMARFCPCVEGPKYLPAVRHWQFSSPPPEDPWSLPYESLHTQHKQTSVTFMRHMDLYIYIWLFLLTCTAWCSSPPDVWIIKSQRKKCFLLYQKQNISFLILFHSIPEQKILNCISIWGKISPPHTLVQARAYTCAFPFWISLLLYFYKALVFTVSHNYV